MDNTEWTKLFSATCFHSISLKLSAHEMHETRIGEISRMYRVCPVHLGWTYWFPSGFRIFSAKRNFSKLYDIVIQFLLTASKDKNNCCFSFYSYFCLFLLFAILTFKTQITVIVLIMQFRKMFSFCQILYVTITVNGKYVKTKIVLTVYR